MNTEAIRYAGIDLRTLGFYAQMVEGYASAPPVRGRNLPIPYQHGQRWTEKYYDERSIVLTGEMFSTLIDRGGARSALYSNLDTLKALFAIEAGEQRLEIQRQDGSYRYIMAEVRNTLGLEWRPGNRWTRFSVELVASDPFWKSGTASSGPALSAWTLDNGVSLDDGTHWLNQTIAARWSQTLTQQLTAVGARNTGTAPQAAPIFTLTGAMTSPKIAHPDNGTGIRVGVATVEGAVVIIDCGQRTATVNGIPVEASVLVADASQWLQLDPGYNTLLVDLGQVSSVAYLADYFPSYL